MIAKLAMFTLVDYRWQLEHYVIPHVGHIRLAKLTPADVQKMLRSLEKAVDANHTEMYAERLADVDRGRVAVIDAINQDLGDINRAVAQFLLSPWQRWRLRGKDTGLLLSDPERRP
jgi:hypothetical protein